MYHVSSDKRSRRSAELIWQGMKECLQEKSLDKLRVTDINQKSFVSRATFYRLFDAPKDVIAYECDCVYLRLAETMDQEAYPTKHAFFLCMIEKWLDEELLIRTVVENNLVSLLYETHRRHIDRMKHIFLEDTALDAQQADYLAAVLANIIPAALTVWYQHGKTESPEEIYRAVSRSLRIIEKEL